MHNEHQSQTSRNPQERDAAIQIAEIAFLKSTGN